MLSIYSSKFCRIATIAMIVEMSSSIVSFSNAQVVCNCQPYEWPSTPCTATQDVVCSNCSTCVDNQYMVQWCSQTHDTICSNCTQCENGVQFSSVFCGPHDYNDNVCTNCSICGPLQFEAWSCSQNHDTACYDCPSCPAGQFRIGGCGPEGWPGVGCQQCSECSGPDQALLSPCNATHDAVCKNCKVCELDIGAARGEYRVGTCGPNSDYTCEPCTECSVNQYELVECRGFQDHVCVNCTLVCPSGQYRVGVCGPETWFDYQCVNCTVCDPNEIEVSPCTVLTDTLCIPNITAHLPPVQSGVQCQCKSYEWPSTPCTATQDAVCQNCSTCADNQYILSWCNQTHDTICKNCTTCESGLQYSPVYCGPHDYFDNDCMKCTVCNETEYEGWSCTQNHDTVCYSCAPCPAEQFRSNGCGPEGWSTSECQNCSLCGPDQFELHSCNATHDTLCKNCTVCQRDIGANRGEYRTGTCGANSDYTCVPCTECGVNQYEARECRNGHDHTCANCTLVCPPGQYRAGICGPETWYDYQCLPCSTCGPNEYELATCSGTIDTLCIPLGQGTP